MYRGGDSVFRLSLVGIAFILICFLLIIFSRMYSDADVARTEALTRLGQRQQESNQPLAQQAFESARQELQAQLLAAGANPDKVISDLLDKAKIETELTTEKKRVQELGAQLVGLGEFRKILTQADKNPTLDGTSTESLVSALELRARLGQELGSSETKLSDSEITSRTLAAVNFKRNIETLVETELGLPLVPGQESAWGQWLITDSQLFKSALAKSDTTGGRNGSRAASSEELTLLRAQVSFLLARLETHGDSIIPPCWFDNTGKIQYLFTIELHPGRSETVIVTPAWPPAREASAQAIPGIKQLLVRKQMPYTSFKERATTIGQHAGKQCRYSVQVKDNLKNGMRSEKVHQELEPFFYLVDMPR